jgi:hypothetical protein
MEDLGLDPSTLPAGGLVVHVVEVGISREASLDVASTALHPMVAGTTLHRREEEAMVCTTTLIVCSLR